MECVHFIIDSLSCACEIVADCSHDGRLRSHMNVIFVALDRYCFHSAML